MWVFMASGPVATNVSIVMPGEALSPIVHMSNNALAKEVQRAQKNCGLTSGRKGPGDLMEVEKSRSLVQRRDR